MTPAGLWIQAARMSLRDWRAGELRLLAGALLIAVAAVSSVGFFVDRMRVGLERDAGQLLGADLVIASDRPLAADLRRGAGLQFADTVVFPSMALAADGGERMALVSVKAVGEGYPLRGTLRTQARLDEPDRPAGGIPAPGTVWVDPQLLVALATSPGAELRLGDQRLRIERLITLEPDRGTQFINFAPRLMLNLADLPATGLIQTGSRVTYRLLVAGAPAAVRGYEQAVAPRLVRGQALETIASGRPEMQRTLERAQRFLSLVALLAAMVAAVAVAASARRFSQRHLDACALLRCLGLSQREIFALFALEFLWLGLAASAVGVLAGFGLHFVLLALLGPLIGTALPLPSALPALHGAAVGLVLLLGFALPPLAQLRRVPPLRVLRKDLGAAGGGAVLGYAAGCAGFLALLLWSAQDLRLGALAAAGFAAALVLFALAGYGVLLLLAPLRAMTGRLGLSWRFAVAAVLRRPAATVVQLVSLALGLMALLLLMVTRTDLIDAWRAAAPADAPNRFVINIQPDQVAAVERRLAAEGFAAVLYPMVRGRLIERNGVALGPQDYVSERARRLVDREFNLSYAHQAPSHNRIVAGRWFEAGAAELSIETGVADTLGIALGDRLAFDIAGQRLEARVTSLRKVDWDSLRANFFVLMPPALLEQQPRSYITAFHLPPPQAGFAAALVREFPNLSVIDTGAVLRQVQAVVEQVVAAVEFLFGFTLAAGVLVLYTALASSRDERVREAALLRALGASRRQLARAQVAEMLCLGALAGLLASLAATAVGWALAVYAFEFDYALSPWTFALGIGGGALCALAGGWVGLRDVLRTPPLVSLRGA